MTPPPPPPGGQHSNMEVRGGVGSAMSRCPCCLLPGTLAEESPFLTREQIRTSLKSTDTKDAILKTGKEKLDFSENGSKMELQSVR